MEHLRRQIRVVELAVHARPAPQQLRHQSVGPQKRQWVTEQQIQLIEVLEF